MCKLFVGLCNPGSVYENNRHNVGFRVINIIATENTLFSSFKKMASLIDVMFFLCDGKKILLEKPLVFRNLSGQAVKFLVNFYKILVDNVYVFHDDIDLASGRVKIKKGGGSGGHNGLKSIDNVIGNNYWRVRIGVGRPQEKSMVSSYVLSNFDSDQQDIIQSICYGIAKEIPLLLQNNQALETKLNSICQNKNLSLNSLA